MRSAILGRDHGIADSLSSLSGRVWHLGLVGRPLTGIHLALHLSNDTAPCSAELVVPNRRARPTIHKS